MATNVSHARLALIFMVPLYDWKFSTQCTGVLRGLHYCLKARYNKFLPMMDNSTPSTLIELLIRCYIGYIGQSVIGLQMTRIL